MCGGSVVIQKPLVFNVNDKGQAVAGEDPCRVWRGNDRWIGMPKLGIRSTSDDNSRPN